MWLVLVPIVAVLTSVVMSLSDDMAPAIGSVALVAGGFAISKFYILPAKSNWECPDCNVKFNFDAGN